MHHWFLYSHWRNTTNPAIIEPHSNAQAFGIRKITDREFLHSDLQFHLLQREKQLVIQFSTICTHSYIPEIITSVQETTIYAQHRLAGSEFSLVTPHNLKPTKFKKPNLYSSSRDAFRSLPRTNYDLKIYHFCLFYKYFCQLLPKFQGVTELKLYINSSSSNILQAEWDGKKNACFNWLSTVLLSCFRIPLEQMTLQYCSLQGKKRALPWCC